MTIPINTIKYRLFKRRTDFRHWLSKNHDQVPELWLAFYKKGTTKKSITNSDAVEEALCFGWINGKVRKLDEEIYIQRFTPRKDKSIWSDINKKRIAELTKKGLMTESGLEKVRIGKKNGSWNSVDLNVDIEHLPDDVATAFKKNKEAEENFKHFTANQQRDYLWWIENAKRADTRKKRIIELIKRCERNIRPGVPF
ncbi:MAG: YdeI/OmpD-associated family protein [Gammaproteobacteria bacterium]|nr:YdeI/OmpD-associated family protein [Gammaproteobacteria bacterium]